MYRAVPCETASGGTGIGAGDRPALDDHPHCSGDYLCDDFRNRYLSLGASTNISFAGHAFTIDGNKWIPPSDNGTAPEALNNASCGSIPVPKFGVAVPDATQQLSVKNNLTAQQQDSVTGAVPNPLGPRPVPSPTSYIMPMGTATHPLGTSISSGTLGTQANPEIVVVDGTGIPATPRPSP